MRPTRTLAIHSPPALVPTQMLVTWRRLGRMQYRPYVVLSRRGSTRSRTPMAYSPVGLVIGIKVVSAGRFIAPDAQWGQRLTPLG